MGVFFFWLCVFFLTCDAERARQRRPGEARVDAVGVALGLAQVGVEARRERGAEDRVHHRDGGVVRSEAIDAGTTELDDGLRGARLVHEVDLYPVVRDGLPRDPWDRDRLSRMFPGAESRSEESLHLGFGDISNYHELRAFRNEGALIERVHACRVECGGRGGIAVGRVVIGVAFGEHDLVERKRRELRGLVTTLQERLEPQVALLLHVVGTECRPEHDVRHQVERGAERALGDVQLHSERLRSCAGVELCAEEREFALQRVRVTRSRALGEHAGGEAREARLSGLEARPAVDDERDVDERQRVVLDHLQRDAILHGAAGNRGKVELGCSAKRGRLGAIESTSGVLRACREWSTCEHGPEARENGKMSAGHWATPFFAASSGLPMGTMEIMTRLAWRYFPSTRWTSAAVTAR